MARRSRMLLDAFADGGSRVRKDANRIDERGQRRSYSLFARCARLFAPARGAFER